MKNDSTFQTILMVIFGGFLILGLFAFATPDTNTKRSEVAGEVVGDYVIWGIESKEKMDLVLTNTEDSFQLKYVQKDPLEIERDLLSVWARGGEGPDLFILPQEWVGVIEEDIEPFSFGMMPARTYSDRYVEGASIFMREEGYIGLPLAVDPIVMYWNRDLFSAARLDPPQTWEDLIRIIPTLRQYDQAGELEVSAVALGGYDNIQNTKSIIATLIEQQGLNIADFAGLTEPLKFFMQFSNSNNKAVYSWDRHLSNSRDVFLSGELAIYFGYASEFKDMQKRNAHLNFDVARVPQLESMIGKKEVTSGSILGVYVVNRSENLYGAQRAASRISQSKVTEFIAESFSIAPARLALLQNVSNSSTHLPVFYDSARISRDWRDPSPVMTDEIFRDMIDDILTKRRSIKGAVGHAAERMKLIEK